MRVETVINNPKGFKVQDTVPGPQGPTVIWKPLGKLVQSQEHAGRRYAGCNVAKKDDGDLFAAVLAGENHLPGFKTEDLRHRLHGDCFDPLIRRRQAPAISRRWKRLQIPGLIAKIPRSHRWRASILGQHLLTKVIRLYYHGLSQAA